MLKIINIMIDKSTRDLLESALAIFAFICVLWLIAFLVAYGLQISYFLHEHCLKIVYSIGALIAISLILKLHKKMKETRMFEKLMMNPEEKEFAKITRDLDRDKYIAFKAYFKATGTSVNSANKFLKSCRGVAFLEAYKKSPMIDNTEISKMILDVEREEQIISCAVDILKLYS